MAIIRIIEKQGTINVTETVVRVVRVYDHNLPAGMLESILTAAGQILGATGPGAPVAMPAPTVEGTIPIARLDLNGKWAWESADLLPTTVLPSTRLNDFAQAELTNYLAKIQAKNINLEFKAGSWVHGATAVVNGYWGAVYSPGQNRIYLVPWGQSNQANWHYIDCETGGVVAYAHGMGALGASAYQGGVYSPTQNRIYLVPQVQSNQATWHYINCDTGAIVAYAHGLGADTPVVLAFAGGVYSPVQNRIYLVPILQANQTKWHYIDCSNGTVVAYTHGATAVASAYAGGVYSPTQNRIYLVPWAQSNQTNWHYINCADGTVVAYAHGATAVANAYLGGVYSPIENRIYLVPYAQSNQTNWHYIDCSNGTVVAYAHGATAVANGYWGGVYSPAQNRIFLVPYAQSNQTNWHYINCATGTVVAYAHGVTAAANGYIGGIYSPAQNRIYLVPQAQSNQTTWHFISEFSAAEISPSLMASTLFNKF